jgi:hypothetical protein
MTSILHTGTGRPDVQQPLVSDREKRADVPELFNAAAMRLLEWRFVEEADKKADRTGLNHDHRRRIENPTIT